MHISFKMYNSLNFWVLMYMILGKCCCCNYPQIFFYIFRTPFKILVLLLRHFEFEIQHLWFVSMMEIFQEFHFFIKEEMCFWPAIVNGWSSFESLQQTDSFVSSRNGGWLLVWISERLLILFIPLRQMVPYFQFAMAEILSIIDLLQ